MRVYFAVAAIALMLIVSVGASGQDVVKKGDPLRIYLRRSPEQNLTFLNLYKAFNASSEDEQQYTLVLGAKNSGWDRMVAYLPTSEDDNSLKYAPNSSVIGQYNFSVLGRAIKDNSDARYRIKVTVEIDYRRSGDFKTDKEFSFVIEGASDAKLHQKVGSIGATASDLKEMDSSKGGRVRLTIERDDNELNTLLLYTGYREQNCMVILPMSREDAGSADGDGSNAILIVLLVFLVASAVVGYFVIDRLSKRNVPEKKAPLRKGKRK